MLSHFHSHLPVLPSSVKCRVQINPNYYLLRLFPQLRPPLLANCAKMKEYTILDAKTILELLVLAMLIKIAVTSKVFWF